MSFTFTVSNYMLDGDIQARDFIATNEVKENGAVNTHGFSQQQMAEVHESEHVREDVIAEESHGFLQPSVNDVQEHAPSSAEEPPEEPLKHTYASIVCVTYQMDYLLAAQCFSFEILL